MTEPLKPLTDLSFDFRAPPLGDPGRLVRILPLPRRVPQAQRVRYLVDELAQVEAGATIEFLPMPIEDLQGVGDFRGAISARKPAWGRKAALDPLRQRAARCADRVPIASRISESHPLLPVRIA